MFNVAAMHFNLSLYHYDIHACRVREFRRFSEKSDVFSFGVFLLELLSGKEASEPPPSGTGSDMVEWVSYQSYSKSSEL